VASTATLSFAPDAPALRKSSIKVGKKDTLASLAAKYKTTPDQLAQWNKMSSQGKLKAGQSLTVYVPVKGKAVAAQGSHRPAAHPGAKASGKTSSKPSARPAPKRKR
jgi:membrane-bound lytic murein transglycosylase D